MSEVMSTFGELNSELSGDTYDLTKLLCEVFDSGDFRRDYGNLDDVQAAEVLDGYVTHLFLGFLDLRAMIEEYPFKKQWTEGNLKKMYDAMVARRHERFLNT
jgi:hypothetical protein